MPSLSAYPRSAYTFPELSSTEIPRTTCFFVTGIAPSRYPPPLGAAGESNQGRPLVSTLHAWSGFSTSVTLYPDWYNDADLKVSSDATPRRPQALQRVSDVAVVPALVDVRSGEEQGTTKSAVCLRPVADADNLDGTILRKMMRRPPTLRRYCSVSRPPQRFTLPASVARKRGVALSSRIAVARSMERKSARASTGNRIR